MIGEIIEYNGDVWEAICLDPNSNLSRKQKMQINNKMLGMYYNRDKKKRLKGEGFEGLALKVGTSVLGTYSGFRYKMDLDIDGVEESTKYGVLMCQKVNVNLN